MVNMKDGEPEPREPCPASLASIDCSFVVLESPSLPQIGVGGMQPVPFPGVREPSTTKPHHNGQVDSDTVESSASNDSPEEVAKKLGEVQQENRELKEMLSQNNLAMRNQLATLLAWQNQVENVFQQHSEKFSETGALIHKLRAENAMLKNIIEEQKCETTTEAESGKLEDLLRVENTELKCKVEELQRSITELRHRASRESPSSKEVELVSLLKQVNERMEETERARRQLGDNVERLSTQRTQLEHELGQLKDQLANQQHHNAILQDQMSTLAAQKQEQPSSREETLRRQVSELQAQCERLSSDNEELSQELDSLRSSLRSKEQQSAAYVEVQSQGYREKLDRLTAELVDREEALVRKDAELKKLLENTKKLQLENEGLEILKAQVDVYQADFMAEREGRERLAGERERLLDELSLLQRANQELSKELTKHTTSTTLSPHPPSTYMGAVGWNTIAAPSRRQPSPRQLSPAPQDNPRAYDEDVPPPRRYVCPVCDLSFTLLDHLEHHVETCLN